MRTIRSYVGEITRGSHGSAYQALFPAAGISKRNAAPHADRTQVRAPCDPVRTWYISARFAVLRKCVMPPACTTVTCYREFTVVECRVSQSLDAVFGHDF